MRLRRIVLAVLAGAPAAVAEDCADSFGSCASYITGSGGVACTALFCDTCAQAGYCDLSCGFMCTEDGITVAHLFILPPGATDRSQAIASKIESTSDKGLSFTATATGTFTVRVQIVDGSGPVTIDVTTIGSAKGRSMRLAATGSPRRSAWREPALPTQSGPSSSRLASSCPSQLLGLGAGSPSRPPTAPAPTPWSPARGTP